MLEHTLLPETTSEDLLSLECMARGFHEPWFPHLGGRKEMRPALHASKNMGPKALALTSQGCPTTHHVLEGPQDGRRDDAQEQAQDV